MNSPLENVIRELLEKHSLEKAGQPEFKEGMLAMGPDGGRFVESIVRAVKPHRGLEIGTSAGYSALCAMKGAFDGFGADGYGDPSSCPFQLITVDYDPAKAAWARENFERAGVGGHIKILIDDGVEAARKVEGPFDYVLIDAAKAQNLPIFKELLPKLSPGAVILTDNMLTHEKELREFAHFVRHHADLASSMFSVGNGIEVTLKLSERS